MKKLFLSLLSLMTITAFAQTTVTNGKIEMTMESDNGQMPAMNMTYYIKGDQVKVETGAEGMFEIATYQDNSKNKFTMTMNMMGMKKGFSATQEELAADNKKDSSAKPVVKYFDETKEIAGYKCKKAVVTVTNPQTGSMDITLWYTPDLKLPKITSAGGSIGGGNAMDGIADAINGMALETSFEVPQGGNMTIKATKVDLKADIKDEVFKVPSDFEIKSYKEFKEEMKGMMGGGN
jgi:hypothetical protein